MSGPAETAAPAAASVQRKLICRGGRTLPDLAYRTFYYGAAWHEDPARPGANPHAVARTRVDQAVAAAMNDPGLNAVVAQYFPGTPVTTTAHASDILDDDPRTLPVNRPFNEFDIRRVIQNLVTGRLAGIDLDQTAINIVLPQGMTVEILGLDEKDRPPGNRVDPGVPRDRLNSSTAIAGYHGSVALSVNGAPKDVLYSVVVWSDGSTGIPVPDWEGWENITATLYHELQEIRTNPDVDGAVRTGDAGKIGWNTDPMPGPDGIDCREIADLPLLLHRDIQFAAFARVALAGGGTVPVQLMWSNEDGCMMPRMP